MLIHQVYSTSFVCMSGIKEYFALTGRENGGPFVPRVFTLGYHILPFQGIEKIKTLKMNVVVFWNKNGQV